MDSNNDFLAELSQQLEQRLGRYTHVKVQRQAALEVPGLPKSLWAQADILILDRKLHTTFIIQDVDDGEMVRRLAQCWPFVEAGGQDVALIQVRKATGPTGGDRDLARFIGDKLQDASDHFRYTMLWRTGHSAKTIAGRVVAKMNFAVEDFEDIKAIKQAMEEYGETSGRPLGEAIAEIEAAGGLRG